MYHIKNLSTLPTYCSHVFRVILRLNRDYSPPAFLWSLNVISEVGTELLYVMYLNFRRQRVEIASSYGMEYVRWPRQNVFFVSQFCV
jgi:hypothetical protein